MTRRYRGTTPNIYDVAKKADVSIATVSRVLNGQLNVIEKTRKKVFAAIEVLKFKPNIIARSLVNPHTRLIQLFMHVTEFPVDFDSTWFSGLVNGTGEAVQTHNYGILINAIAGLPNPMEIHKRVFNQNADGIIMVSPNLEEKDVARMLDQRIPIVLIEYRMKNPKSSFVDTNNFDAMEKIVHHLVSLGHRKIACLAGPVHMNRNAQDRLEGFQRAMDKHQLPIPKSYMLAADFYSRKTGYQGMKRLLSLSERPTAVFAANDSMALGAWDSATQAGLRLGSDISLVGYDDIPASSTSPYSLTTIRQDFYRMAIKATEVLLENIKNPSMKIKKIFMPAQLIKRNSTGRPRR